MKRPKISICIGTYNQQNYIRECLLSVLAQQCDAYLEVLVGNDCSRDDTGAIIDEVAACYPGRVQVPARERNLGAAGNYQDLIARSSGDYIAHLDGDDYWLPGKLAAQLAFMRGHPQCVAVYTNAVVVDEGGRSIGAFNNEQPMVFDSEYLLKRGNFLNYSSMFYDAKFKDTILDIKEEFIDYRMHVRLSRFGRLGYINNCLVSYRLESRTSVMKSAPEKVQRLYWQALRDTDEGSAGRKFGMARFLAAMVGSNLLAGRFEQALKWVLLIGKETGKGVAAVLMLGICWEILLRLLNKVGEKTGLREEGAAP